MTEREQCRQARKVVSRFLLFMRLNATARQIWMQLNLTSAGCDWRGMSKSDMAEAYALSIFPDSAYPVVIYEDTYLELAHKFGTR